ncbi:MAG TPA: SDR family oxidoreductase [Sphingopyxis sp.]|uniref:SDR family NAD(P)-dependent oxidoreductase n=1 Tax=Sphingopyxis sp. TaxID=1908224 RepID=UPI002C0C253F|nr:SDR family oxidoreductase [Sphingopyxis sp.]HWW57629.1 SDR family oxidoreductase [Sphingopyxis sp.]
MASLSGKVALVTGAASGIGTATADLLEATGAEVWRADVVPSVDLRLDVTEAAHWSAAVDRIMEASGRLDILVNAAGIAAGGGPASVEAVSIDHWRRVFAVNVEGTLLGCQQALRVMGRPAPGSIVNIASTAATAPSQALGAYGASKAAVVQLTRSVAAAAALAGLPIRCNCVQPGMADTPMTADMDPFYRQAWIAQIPAGRFAEPVEIARAILFLASEESAYVNGVSLPVDGGLLHRPVIAASRSDS